MRRLSEISVFLCVFGVCVTFVSAAQPANLLETLLQRGRTSVSVSVASPTTAASPSCPASPPPADQRLACGSWWEYAIDPAACVARGCCYKPSLDTLHWCFLPPDSPEPFAPITTIHVVQGGHLDIGFVSTAPDIVNRWFDNFFPLAHAVGSNLSALVDQPARLNFTAQPWLISLYLDCPPGMGIHCPSPAAQAQLRDSITKGFLTYHAFPFNAQPELFDRSLFAAGVDLSHELDDMLGVPRKTVMSQRDVPGMTRAVIPLLVARGIHTISVGVNGGSTPPNTPPVFVWRDVPSNTSVRGLYVSGGYGGLSFLNKFGIWEVTTVPGSSHALLIDWRGDNAGPDPTSTAALANWANMSSYTRLLFPNSTLVPSTFDAFAEVLHNDVPDSALPTVTSEIGDTWIHGVGAAPRRLAQTRTAMRLRTRCIESGACNATSDPRVANFTRLLLKANSHTDGGDQKTFVPSMTENWTNQEWRRAFANKTSGWQALAQTYATQDLWDVQFPVQALGDHPLADDIRSAWKAGDRDVPPSPPSPHCVAFSPAQIANKTWTVGRFMVGFDPDSGGVAVLTDVSSGFVWANHSADGSMLAQLVYVTYDQHDFSEFISDYNYMGPFALVFGDDLKDFDKVGLGDAGVKRQLTPTLTTLWQCDGGVFHANVSFPFDVHTVAGAPRYGIVTVSVADNAVNTTVQVVDKTATRVPEAMFLRMTPAAPPAGLVPHMVKMGAQMDPRDVLDGGAKHMHVVDSVGFTRPDSGAVLDVLSPTGGLVSFGALSAFPTPTRSAPDFHLGAAFVLWDNIWDTNYATFTTDDSVAIKFKHDIVVTAADDGPSPPLVPPTTAVPPLPPSVQRGVVSASFVSSTAGNAEAVVELAKAGLQWTTAGILLTQDHLNSTNPGPGPHSPSDDALVEYTKAALGAGVEVMWKVLMVIADGSTWAYAAPSNATAWFQSYGDQLVHYAQLAEASGATAMCLGTEMAHLTVHEELYGKLWEVMVARVRAVAPTLKLTYAALYAVEYPNATHLWRQLDAIGIDAYFPLWSADNPASPTVDDLVDAWQPHLHDIAAYVQSVGLQDKPVWFTEIGYCSYATATVVPGSSPETCSGQWAADGAAQAVAYEALFRAVGQTAPLVDAVFLFWLDSKGTSDYYGGGNGAPNGDKYPCFFTPRGKPAYDVLLAAYAQPTDSTTQTGPV